jgi:chromosome segregation ATPase
MISNEDYKYQISELAHNIQSLTKEVHHLRNEKKIIQRHLNNLIQDIESLNQEISQSMNKGDEINSGLGQISGSEEFPNLVISHTEKLMIREKLRQMIEKIEFELQRY